MIIDLRVMVLWFYMDWVVSSVLIKKIYMNVRKVRSGRERERVRERQREFFISVLIDG